MNTKKEQEKQEQIKKLRKWIPQGSTVYTINPDLIRWAIKRSGAEIAGLKTRFPKIEQWVDGESVPTANELESFAKATLTPYGYLFLPQPPDESLPVPDFRTVRDRGVKRTSAALLETIQPPPPPIPKATHETTEQRTETLEDRLNALIATTDAISEKLEEIIAFLETTKK